VLNTAPPTVAVAVRGVRKRFTAGVDVLRGVDLDVAAGSVVALLGPSGCGKTTLLRTIAGLERPDAGEVRIAGTTVSSPSTHVAPEKRRVGMVFQDWALFPHLTVAENVGYGLRRAERHGPRVDEALALVGLSGLGQRAPGTLSGGQQQRVALARAIAPRPAVLLLDEPFSNLDTSLRVQVRTELHQLLAELGITSVFVTHDQEEAFVLGDEVAVMEDGRIVQQSSPAGLYDRPATPWVATFVGDANLVAARASGDVADTPVGRIILRDPASGPVQVLLRPEELRVDSGSTATVDLIEYFGHDTVYFVRLDPGTGEPGDAPLRVRVGSAPRFRRGDRVDVSYAGPPALAYGDGARPAPQVSSAGAPVAPVSAVAAR
jgi:iron(III) transport system ATP-binding protein